MRGKKIASSTIVSSPKFRGANVTQALNQLRAIDDVGEEQRAGSRRGMRCQADDVKLLGIERYELIRTRKQVCASVRVDCRAPTRSAPRTTRRGAVTEHVLDPLIGSANKTALGSRLSNVFVEGVICRILDHAIVI